MIQPLLVVTAALGNDDLRTIQVYVNDISVSTSAYSSYYNQLQGFVFLLGTMKAKYIQKVLFDFP